MTRESGLSYVLAVVLVLGSQAASATLYYSEDNNSNGLYTIDTATGAATLVGTSGVVGGTVGLAPSGVSSTLFGGEPFGLLRISTDGSGSSSVGSQGLEGLAYDAANDILYGQLNSDFFTVNQTTGVKIDNVADAPGDMDGLAFGRNGVFGLNDNNDSLYFYNPASDIWSLIGSIGIGINNPGLAYDPVADLLYATGGSQLLSINPTTAVATVVGATGLGANGGGLAFVAAPVPAPATLLLLALGLAGISLRHRNQHKAQ